MAQPTIVRCINCGDDYTHFNHTVVVARPLGEDEVIELIYISAAGIITRDLLDRNRGASIYKSRRNATWLVGECENCDSKTVITLTQYKGQTFFNVVGEDEAQAMI